MAVSAAVGLAGAVSAVEPRASMSIPPVTERAVHAVDPTDQSEAPVPRATTAAIRRALVDDDSLSLAAKNLIVVTTADGVVTMRGTVPNDREKAIVLATAHRLCRSGRVVDQVVVRAP